MSIEVKHVEGAWMEKLVFMPRVVVNVYRNLDGQIFAVKVPTVHGTVVPF